MLYRRGEFKYFLHDLKQYLEQSSARQWINRNPWIMIGITAVSILVLLIVVIAQLAPEQPVEVVNYKKAWFYDLNTGKLFVAKSNAVPPIKAPSGPLPNGQPAGVKAYVFSYEPNDSDNFIGFLEIHDHQAKNSNIASGETKSDRNNSWGHDKLIRRVADEQWVPADSGQGRAILRKIYLPNENGKRPHYCSPP
jgi:hypothetical protein